MAPAIGLPLSVTRPEILQRVCGAAKITAEQSDVSIKAQMMRRLV
jgi:hypothetical protein